MKAYQTVVSKLLSCVKASTTSMKAFLWVSTTSMGDYVAVVTTLLEASIEDSAFSMEGAVVDSTEVFTAISMVHLGVPCMKAHTESSMTVESSIVVMTTSTG